MVITLPQRSGSSSSSDADLISRSLEDGGCFGTLFERHAAAIYRYAAARVGPVQAEDILSDVFEVAFDRRTRFDTTATSARPWLYGIATNRLKKFRENEHQWLARSALATSTSDGSDVADRSIDRADAQRLAPAIANVLLGLSPAERDVLLLNALEGLDSREIADALGIRHGAARTRLARARARVKALLAFVDDREEGNDA